MHTTTLRKSNPAGRRARAQAGFSMLEVLISLVLIAAAIFGNAGLKLISLKFTKDASTRVKAVLLSNELAERMEANKVGSIAGNYAVSTTSTVSTASTNCATSACDPSALAAYDLAEWTARVAATLYGSSWAIAQTTSGNPSTYTITVNWEGRRANADTTYASAGTTETLSLTSTKVVYQ